MVNMKTRKILLIGRIGMIIWIPRPHRKLFDNAIGGRLIGVPDPEAYHIYTLSLGFIDLFPELHKQIRRDLAQAIGQLHNNLPIS